MRVDRIALWLAGVQSDRLKPAFRPKIEAYQDELAPVAMQVFLRVAGIESAQLVPASADPQAVAIAEQIDELSAAVNLLREHLDSLVSLPGQVSGLSVWLDQAILLLESLATRQEATDTQVARIDARTQRLTPAHAGARRRTPAHAREVQEMVDRMVRETKRLPVPLTYAASYGRLKHRFRVGSYNEMPDERFADVMAHLREELLRAADGEAPEQGSLF